MPAIAASSPVLEGRVTGVLDNRLNVYRRICARIPSVTGRVIPETVRSEAEYREQILAPMYGAFANDLTRIADAREAKTLLDGLAAQ